MPEEDLYELLQVRSTADLRTVQAAYRRLMLLHHPDRNAGVDAQEMAQRLNRAYEVLSDPELRAEYDQMLESGLESGLGPENQEAGNGGRSSRPVVQRRGIRRFGGYSRPVWIAASAGILAIVIVLIAVISGPLSDSGQPPQAAAEIPAPGPTPSIVPSPTIGGNAAAAVPAPTPTPSASFHLSKASAFMKLQQYEEAVEEFTTAINLIPDYGFSYQSRGNAYYRLRRYELAIEDFGEALRIDANDKAALRARGLANYQLDRYRLAIKDLDKAIQLDSDDAVAFRHRGLAHGELEEFQLARLDAERACLLDIQYCPSLALSATAPPADPTATPVPVATPTTTPPPAGGGVELFLLVSSKLSIRSNLTVRFP